MQQGIPHAQIERFKSAGHFIMLDDPQRFNATLISFLNNEVAHP
jgi:pimeloyl-ACP methyl ester carboxylesterase